VEDFGGTTFAIESTSIEGEALRFASLHVFGATPTARIPLNDARSVCQALGITLDDLRQ